MKPIAQLLLIFCFAFNGALAGDLVFAESGVAIRGYDAVSYHSLKQAVKGESRFSHQWRGVNWLFSSQQNRDLFAQDPGKYAPQYGGHCAYAVSRGYVAPVDPEAWTLHQGKLYLNYSKSVRGNWQQDIPGNIKKGDANWPKLSAQ